MKFPYVSEEELRRSLGCNRCVSGDEVTSFSCRVYRYHDRVVSVGFWEFYYEVDRDRLPSFAWDLEGLEFAEGPMPLCLGPKAEIASATVLTYVPRHLRPPVGSGDELECLPPTRVSGDEGV